jgi:hypothetical protein
VSSPHELARLALRVFAVSAREAGRNAAGLVLLVAVPVVFLGAVQLTAGDVLTAIKLYYPGETLKVTLTARQVCLVFGTVAICGFLAAYYAMTLFHHALAYFRFWVVAGLPPLAFLLGRLGFYMLVVLSLGSGTMLLTGRLVHLEHPGTVLLGFLLLGLVYGCCGGIAGLLARDPLIGFLVVAILADIDAAWLQNPAYYTAGQNLDFIRWLPAFHPSQLVLSGAFTEDPNTHALLAGGGYGAVLFAVFLAITSLRLGRARGPAAGTAGAPPASLPTTPAGAP